ncbi:MAG: T9SS type A sorting domain-containing protein [Bacteroidia bacterium]
MLLILSIISSPLLAQPGSIDNTFNTNGNPSTIINAVHVLPSGKLLVGATNDLNPSPKISRHNADGTIDNTFQPNFTSWNGTVESIATTSNGSIIVGGSFNVQSLGVTRSNLVRLFPDGGLDTSFKAFVANSWVTNVVVQPDEKIVVLGYFTTFNGAPQNRILRLNSNGTADIAFNQNVGSGLSFGASKIHLDANGKITIWGAFTFNNTDLPGGLVRLNSNGTIDNTFSIGSGPGNFENIYDFAYTTANKILLAGTFSTVNGTPANDLILLNYDGTPDPSFSSGVGPTCCGILNVIEEPNSGKIIIANGFYDYNGTLRANLARLNSNGTLDATYDPGAGFVDNSTINTLMFDSNGKLLIGGGFNSYNNISRINLVRINGGELVAPLEISIIGTATEAGTFSTDYQMTTTDGINYSRTNLLLAGDPNISNPETKVKFRQNYNWAVNWGASTFPTGTGTQDGPDIPIMTPGFYTVSINIQTGAYTFTLTAPPPSIGMIGSALNGWTTDVFMEPVDGKNYIAYGVNLSAGEMKFRQDGAWAINWGANAFPQGSGFQDGPNIPIPSGVYSVSFNRKTGAYSFDVTVGNENANNDNTFNVAPQPCGETLSLKGLSIGNYTYRIFSVSGNIAESGSLNSSNIDVNKLPKGIYVLQLSETSGKTYSRRFVKSE